MVRTRIKIGDIFIGKPLLWDVFDEKGYLLLHEGAVVESEFQLNALIQRGIYRHGIKGQDESGQIEEKRSPFELMDDVYERLDRILHCKEADEKISPKIIKICRILQQSCEQDLDASLGILSMHKDYKYPIIHAVHTALVCKTILQSLGWSSEEQLMPVAAALTMNISMIDLQENLYFQYEPLSEQQKEEIRSHPERSVAILEKCAVMDEVWLNAILQHHEMMDASGYPRGLKGDDIAMPARIISIGDIYCAQVSARAYRESIHPSVALRRLLVDKKQYLDESILQIFIKKLGLYPPGSFVVLKNGEIAVVTHVGKDARYPVLRSILKANGRPFATPVIRDCTQSDFSIKRTVSQSDARIEVNRYQLWGYI
jgi:HD-GYP domain-containing protein (c-di-GMP phosphodiesterase class II)